MSSLPPTIATSSRRISLLEMFRAQRDPLRFLDSLKSSSADVVHLTFGRLSVALLKHPDLVQQMLVAENATTEKGRAFERALFFQFLGGGLLNSKGEEHRRQRRLVLPAFHRSRLAGYGNAMVEAADRVTAQWRDGEVRDLTADMFTLTLDVVGHTLFSADVKGTAQAITDAFNQLSIGVNRLSFPGAKWLLRSPLSFARKIRRGQATLDAIVYALIRERRSRLEDTGDLLSMLLLAEDAEHPGQHLSDEEVRDQVMTLFFAGHETTSNALTWTCWLLARHPAIEAALHAELAQVLGDRAPTFADVPNLVLTEQVIRESMRLYPPVWAMARRTLVELDFAGQKIPCPSLLVACPWITHRDARWFPDPDQFQPTRWTREFRTALPRFAYFPFGGGARSCIGENFAWMEFILIIARFAQQWRFGTTADSHLVKPQGRITLHPDRPVQLRLQRR
ncbi:MAG: cytochrome [Verrucomicrobia bacterium]|nr:cytochrome [Verrucomicrobiota bacterium]